MNRPSFYSIDIWASCEKSILLILSKALEDLHNYTDASKDEDMITVDLDKIIARVRHNRTHKTLADYGNVICQAQNQPLNAIGVAENDISLRKEPDLLWAFYDVYAISPEKSQRYFTIECKCLSANIHDKNYVVEGIKRFILDDWGYSRYEKSGAMVGYIKQNTVAHHLEAVNDHISKQRYPTMMGVISNSTTVNTYIQQFTTRDFEPQSFTLHHLWANIGN